MMNNNNLEITSVASLIIKYKIILINLHINNNYSNKLIILNLRNISNRNNKIIICLGNIKTIKILNKINKYFKNKIMIMIKIN